MKTNAVFTKTNTILLIFGVFIILFTILFYWFFVNNALNEETKMLLHESSKQSAALVEAQVKDNLGAIRDVATVIGEYGLENKNIIGMLQQVTKNNGFKRMAIILPDGDAYATDVDNSIASNRQNFSDRAYFKASIKGKTVVSDVIADRISGGFITVFSTPIFVKHKIVGVLIATNGVENFQKILNIESFAGEGFAYLVTSSGNAIATTQHDNARIMTESIDDIFAFNNKEHKQKKEMLLKEMKANQDGTIRITVDGETFLVHYTPVIVNDWYLLSFVPEKAVTVWRNKIIFATLQLLLGFGIIFALLLWRIMHGLKQTNSELNRLAYYDELTGVPNFPKFKLCLEQIVANYPNHNFMVTKFDISKFKMLNEIFDTETGDKVIKTVAHTFKQILTEPYTVYARINADEFIILDSMNKNKYENEDILYAKYDKQIALFEEEFQKKIGFLGNYRIVFRYGRYALKKGDTVATIIENTALAHHIAKTQKHSNICDFKDDLKNRALREIEIENKMKPALENDEFKLFIQPKYRISDKKIVGAEALVRWQQPDGTFVMPNDFIPVFEKNGFIISLDFKMLEKSCAMIAHMIEQHIPPVTISVNFSRMHIGNSKFLERLCETVDTYKIPHQFIELEITESAIFENEKTLIDFLTLIRYAGFSLAMDDFGTGYSSLGALKNMPIDTLKLDRSFFVDVKSGDDRSQAVVGTILDLSKKLNMHNVAEGVEEKEQVDILQKLGCDVVQGYYFAKPMPFEEFVSLLKKEMPINI